jgi:hypothetical protein
LDLLLIVATAQTASKLSSLCLVSSCGVVLFKRLSLKGAVLADLGLFLLPSGRPLALFAGGSSWIFGLFLLPGGLPLGFGTGAGGSMFCCSNSG